MTLPGNLYLGNKAENFVRVNFSNRGLSRVVQSVRSLNELSPDKSTVVDVADVLSQLKVETREPTTTLSVSEFLGLDYVGYIIDKERLNKSNGEWLRTEEFKIVGSEASNFKDSRVAYGNQYRYRIKSIMKVTTKRIKQNYQNFDLRDQVDIQKVESIKRNLESSLEVIANIDRVANLGISAKTATGEKPTIIQVLNNLSVNLDSNQVRLSNTASTSSSTLLANLRQTQNLVTNSLDFTKGIISRDDLQRQINDSLGTFLEESVEFMSLYFESDPSRNWLYVDTSKDLPPPPPTAIEFAPNTPKRCVCISWLKPPSSERDIKRFRIYRRENLGDEWVRLVELDHSENVHLDQDLPITENGWIYALTSVDVHNIESLLSSQVRVRLNPSFVAEKQERLLKFISGPGISPKSDEKDQISKKFIQVPDPVIALDSFTISPTKDFNETDKSLVIRVTSLDVHETKEFKVNLRNVNIKEVEAIS